MQTKTQKPGFGFPEDERFFAYILGEEGISSARFDFSEPRLKRAAFNKIRKITLRELADQGRNKCELRLVEDCDSENLVIDHIIPISTNELNKHLRGASAPIGRKVPRQSFGSNHPSNFLVACAKCNGFKKHRFVMRQNQEWVIVDVKSIKNLLQDP